MSVPAATTIANATNAAANPVANVANTAETINAATASVSDTAKVKAPSILLRFAGWLFDLLSRPQPVGRYLRRRERAIRHYKYRHRSRVHLHQIMMVAGILTAIICVTLTLVFFNTDLIRPHFAPNTPFAGITVLIALSGAAIAIHAGCQLHGINTEAGHFAEFYLRVTNEDGTVNIDPASDHDYGDRVIDGRVFVKMAEIYDWFYKQD